MVNNKLIYGAIEDRIAAEKRGFDIAIANLEAQQRKTIELSQKRDDAQRALLDSRGGLAEARSNLAQTKVQTGIDKSDRALQIRQRLDDKNAKLDPGVRKQLEAELQSLGFGINESELQILQKKQELENQLAEEKKKALLEQQQLAQKQQEFDLKRLNYAAKTAEFEARIALAKARSSEVDAKGQLEKAKQMTPGKERDEAIASATDQIKIATEGVDFAKENLKLAQEQKLVTAEQIENARAKLAAEQEAQRMQLGASEDSRTSQQRMAIAETAAKAAASVQQEFQGQNNIVPVTPTTRAISIKDQLAQQPDAEFLKANVPTPPDLTGRIAELTQGLEKQISSISSPQRQTIDAPEVVAELKQINANLIAVASRPSTLQVSSPTPVTDAAQIYQNLAKNTIRRAGL